MSKHSKCTDTYEKIDEAALWDLLLFLSILGNKHTVSSLKYKHSMMSLSSSFSFDIAALTASIIIWVSTIFATSTL